MLIIFTTTGTIQEAEDLSRKIIGAHLAACVQLLPQMKSFYFWDDEIQTESECLLLIKTLEEKYPAIEAFIKKNHSYSVPEILAVPADKVSDSYFEWVRDFVQKPMSRRRSDAEN